MENKERIFRVTLATLLMTGCTHMSEPKPTRSSSSSTLFTSQTFTPTPFQPKDVQTPLETPVTPEIPTPTEAPPPYKMFGIDFSNPDKKIDIQITLSEGSVFNINAFPTTTCGSVYEPGEHFSCNYQFSGKNPEDMLHFVHSGYIDKGKIKLEAEDIRHFIEDPPGNWDARLTPEQIKKNMEGFLGATVNIIQGDTEAYDLKVLAIVRVPPDKLGPFSHNPYMLDGNGEKILLTNEDIVATLAGIDPAVAEFESDGKPQIVVVFCGWQNPAEKKLQGVDPYDAADYYQAVRYAIILGK